MEEVRYWRDKHLSLSPLCQQLARPQTKQLLRLMKLADLNDVPLYKTALAELQKEYLEVLAG